MINLSDFGGIPDDPDSLKISEPTARALPDSAPVADPGSVESKDQQNSGYNRDDGSHGPGGVCGEPPVDPFVSLTPSDTHPLPPLPLSPDQPTPPGTPEPLASPESSIPKPDDTKKSDKTHLTQSPRQGLCSDSAPLPPKKNGLVSPFKPQTPEQIAAFVRLWHDPTLTNPEIAKRYHVARKSITTWSKEFGLMDRIEAIRTKAGLAGALGEVADVSRAMLRAQGNPPQASAVTGTLMPPGFDKRWDPMQDQDIALGFTEVMEEAKKMTAHSAIRPLRRKVLRLALVIAMKSPAYTYQTAGVTLETMASALLAVERVEGDLPQGGADPMTLRREAGTQLMNELKSVLNHEDQQTLARLITVGAAKLMEQRRAKDKPGEQAAPGQAPENPGEAA